MEVQQKKRFPSPIASLWMVLVAFSAMQVLGYLIQLLWANVETTPTMQYIQIAVEQFLVIALPAAMYLRYKRPEASIRRFHGLPIWAGLALLVAGICAMFALSLFNAFWVLFLRVLGVPLVTSGIMTPGTDNEVLLATMVIAIAPALCEELLFRGTVLPSLESLGTRRAVVISSLLFSLMHGQSAALPAHLILGFLLGILLVGYGSMWAPMIFHAAYNGSSMLYTVFAQRVTAATGGSGSQADAFSTLAVYFAAVPMMLYAGMAAFALMYFPMRAVAKRNSPPFYQPSGDRLPIGAKVLLVVLFAYFLFQYIVNMYPLAWAPGAGA